jgi:polyphenol oxidase
MSFQQSGDIRYFIFDSLVEAGANNAVVTRHGGVSPHPWASLNLGGTVGDSPSYVTENRARFFKALKRSVNSVFDVWQVHGSEVVCSKHPRPLHQAHQKADAIITDNPGVTLFMRFADCVPVFLHDPKKKAVGLVHAGWQGTVKGVISRAVEVMDVQYGSNPSDIIAAIGPSIGPDHYEIGEDVATQVQDEFGMASEQFMQKVKNETNPDERNQQNVGQDRFKLDLWQANYYLLQQAGVKTIMLSGICTACHLDDWYSHRAENGKTGRFGAVIWLQQ